MYMSDKIGDDYKEWIGDRPIVIEAPTGSGKTHFVLNVLLPWAASQGKKVLYLSNRTALKQQIEAMMKNREGQIKNSFRAMNYQQFSVLILNMNWWQEQERYIGRLSDGLKELKEKSVWAYEADYLVMDEAHFFLSDAEFNTSVGQCLNKIERLPKGTVRIFMTATTPHLWLSLGTSDMTKNVVPTSPRLLPYTRFFANNSKYGFDADLPVSERVSPNPLKDPFCCVEAILDYREGSSGREYFEEKFDEYQGYFEAIKTQCVYYYIKENYGTRIKPVYYDTNAELASAIQRSPKDEKWLVFVESKREGEVLRDSLLDIGINEAIFIHRENRASKRTHAGRAFSEIVKKEKFSCRILITTKVLDNGVNIKDKKVQHIVIDTKERTEFLQMLGRKRFLDDECVNIYLRNYSEGAIRRCVQMRILPYIRFWYDIERVHDRDRGKDLIDRGSMIFLEKYAQNGHFKKPYDSYIELSTYPESLGNPPKKETFLTDNYHFGVHQGQKLTYDYYDFLSLFERARNEREERLKAEKIENKEAERLAKKEIEVSQLTWLREQLSWIGMEYDATRWITYVTGSFEEKKQELMLFLKNNEGILTEEKEKELKQLFRAFIAEVKPTHPDARSKGSVAVINRCLKEFEFSYVVQSRKQTRYGKQRRWWWIVLEE